MKKGIAIITFIVSFGGSSAPASSFPGTPPAVLQAFQSIQSGSVRFRSKHQSEDFTKSPLTAMVLSCAGQWTSPETLFDQPSGSLFVIRSATTSPGEAEVATLEKAIKDRGAPLLIVLMGDECSPRKSDPKNQGVVVTKKILERSKFIRDAVSSGKLGLMQAFYETRTGRVLFWGLGDGPSLAKTVGSRVVAGSKSEDKTQAKRSKSGKKDQKKLESSQPSGWAWSR